jgi:hypothetical protein
VKNSGTAAEAGTRLQEVHHRLFPNEPDRTAKGICALAIMTKAPWPGQVKTRLTPLLTAHEAATLNKCFLRDTAAAIARVGQGTRGVGCYTPVGSEAVYEEIFPETFQLIAQRGTSLDERLIQATEDLFAIGFSSVCLIASDSPTVPTATFVEAVSVLSALTDSAVIGPSQDGGYYLIGLKAVHQRLFEEIEWSTSSVCEQTIARATEIGLPVHLLPPAYDVDGYETLRQLCHDLLGPDSVGTEIVAPATRKFLRELVARDERIWRRK